MIIKYSDKTIGDFLIEKRIYNEIARLYNNWQLKRFEYSSFESRWNRGKVRGKQKPKEIIEELLRDFKMRYC